MSILNFHQLRLMKLWKGNFLKKFKKFSMKKKLFSRKFVIKKKFRKILEMKMKKKTDNLNEIDSKRRQNSCNENK